jgi:pimeloyl-ACP methyl ester carboxylesterase
MPRLIRAPFLLLGICAFSTGCVDAATAESASAHVLEPASATLLSSTDRFFRTGDVTLRYREIGKGDPVLLIHGYSDHVEMWAGPADSLARTHRVIVPDVRGFGKSTKFADPLRYGRRMVDDLLALLTELRVKRVHVIGYSMGGLLAAHMALREPQLVATATLVAGAFFLDSTDAARAMRPYIDSLAGGKELTPFLRWIVPSLDEHTARAINTDVMGYNDTGALIAVLRTFGALGIDWAEVRRSRVPMVAVVGVEDPLLDHSRRIVSGWSGSRLVEVTDGDHINITNTPAMLSAFRAVTSGAALR